MCSKSIAFEHIKSVLDVFHLLGIKNNLTGFDIFDHIISLNLRYFIGSACIKMYVMNVKVSTKQRRESLLRMANYVFLIEKNKIKLWNFDGRQADK